jgi:hypothetical protein
MEALYNRELYGEATALAIETQGSTAISIANRWALGWPAKVMALLVARQYLPRLTEQTETEKDVLAQETALGHLATSEILQLHGIRPEPPEVA